MVETTALFATSAFHTISSILLPKLVAHEVLFHDIVGMSEGKANTDDSTIKHGLVREMQQATGLEVNLSIIE